jgi:hypothetical protein
MTVNNMSMNKKQSRKKLEPWLAAAERAFRRAAQNVRAENKRWGLPLIGWKNGKVVEIDS